MNSKHKNLKFYFEIEKGGKIPFLGVNVYHENSNFVTNVYSKETFTRIYVNFPRLIPLEYRFSLVRTLFHAFFVSF